MQKINFETIKKVGFEQDKNITIACLDATEHSNHSRLLTSNYH